MRALNRLAMHLYSRCDSTVICSGDGFSRRREIARRFTPTLAAIVERIDAHHKLAELLKITTLHLKAVSDEAVVGARASRAHRHRVMRASVFKCEPHYQNDINISDRK